MIREADAIVGDLRSQSDLLQEALSTVERHDVGDHSGYRSSHSKTPQAVINQRLVELAQQGKMVVRLWPGDPFIYGRAAQEIAYARQAGVRVELVPGITSAIAGPAYAGVPLTDWEYNTSFAVVTGYESKNPQVTTDWPALAKMDPLVILMPLDNLAQIVDKLLDAGRLPETPVLAVQHGTLPSQRQVLARLDTIVEAVVAHQIDQHRTIIVVGQVADLSQELAWLETDTGQPLRGKRILVTRPAHQAIEFMSALRKLGADPISFPTIEIQAATETEALDRAIVAMSEDRAARIGYFKADEDWPQPPSLPYDWLVFTSVNGVFAFWERLKATGFDSRSLSFINVAAIGPATTTALNQRSITPDLVPQVYTAEGILAAFDALGSVRGQRFLLPRADIARKALTLGLRDRGATVDEIAAYRTVPRQDGPRPPAADIITFTSSSTVQGYVNCLAGCSLTSAFEDRQVVCIGPITAKTAEQLGVPVSAVAETYTIDGILETLVDLSGR